MNQDFQIRDSNKSYASPISNVPDSDGNYIRQRALRILKISNWPKLILRVIVQWVELDVNALGTKIVMLWGSLVSQFELSIVVKEISKLEVYQNTRTSLSQKFAHRWI
jgi:hypothetical protein